MSRTISRLLNRLGPTDNLNDPLWTVRLSPSVCAVFFGIGETMLRHGQLHPVVLAMGWIQLITLSIAMFRAQDTVCNGSVRGEHSLFRAIWTLRLLPPVCAATILAAEFLPTGNLHDALIGFAAGLLIAVLFTGFATSEVIASATRPYELQQLHLRS